MCMRSCIDIENLCFFCSPFFSSNIFYLFIFPSERTRIVESFIQFFFSPIRFRHHFCAVIVAVILLSISFALCRAIYLRDLIRIQSQSPNGHHSIRFYRNTFLLKNQKLFSSPVRSFACECIEGMLNVCLCVPHLLFFRIEFNSYSFVP